MDIGKGGITIDKLRDDNFHTWKQRIRFVLSIRDLDDYLEDDPPKSTDPEYRTWRSGDKKARALIGLSLSDAHLEQVAHATTAREMWKSICDIYEKHTLLNKLAARRRFYTATMNEGEKVLAFAARIRQLAATLKSMGVKIDDEEMAMGLLNGLPDRFDGLISALDALGDDTKVFTFDFVLSRCEQEEQRHTQRDQDALQKAETAALLASLNKKKELCTHCGKHPDSSKCFFKYPYLAPPNHPARRGLDKAFLSQEVDQSQSQSQSEKDDGNAVCLLGVTSTVEEPNVHYCLNANIIGRALPKGSRSWVIDSGCSSHLTYDRSAFTSYTVIHPKVVDLGANSTAKIVGQGDVTLSIRVKGKLLKCIIKNVKHVPMLRYQLLSVSTMCRARRR